MAPEPESLGARLREPVALPGWGVAFLVLMAGSVVAQLLLLTLSMARVLPHFRALRLDADLGLFAYWLFGLTGCVGSLLLFGLAWRRLRRLHLAILGLAAAAVLLHAFLLTAARLLFGPPSPGGPGALFRGVWALLQPGHGTAYLSFLAELLRTLGLGSFDGYWRSLRLLFPLDAALVTAGYLALWLQARPAQAQPAQVRPAQPGQSRS